jgi:hypothetical protein
VNAQATAAVLNMRDNVLRRHYGITQQPIPKIDEPDLSDAVTGKKTLNDLLYAAINPFGKKDKLESN